VRVSLAGEDELDGQLRVVDQRRDAFHISQHQVRPLVGRKPAGKSDGERVARERLAGLPDEFRRLPATLRAARRAQSRDIDQLGLQRLMRLPDLAIVDAVDGIP
jgi:hypothetical protein